MIQKKNKKGKLFIVSAPSGAGKTTLVKGLVETIANLYVSVSHTTRPQRPYEKNGHDYHFVSEQEFQELVSKDQFLEHASVFDYHYGTSKAQVKEQLADGKDIVLEIDWQGAKQVRNSMPEAIGIFILPPSYETLESRLHDRGDDEDVVGRRMRDAKNEISHYREYNFFVINDVFNDAVEELAMIVRTAQHSYTLNKEYFDDLVKSLLQNS